MLEFTKYFSIEFIHEIISDVNPYDVRAAVMKLIGVDSLNISGGSGGAFTVQVNDRVQGVKLRELTQVKSNLCRVAEHRFLNFCRGIICRITISMIWKNLKLDNKNITHRLLMLNMPFSLSRDMLRLRHSF